VQSSFCFKGNTNLFRALDAWKKLFSRLFMDQQSNWLQLPEALNVLHSLLVNLCLRKQISRLFIEWHHSTLKLIKSNYCLITFHSELKTAHWKTKLPNISLPIFNYLESFFRQLCFGEMLENTLHQSRWHSWSRWPPVRLSKTITLQMYLISNSNKTGSWDGWSSLSPMYPFLRQEWVCENCVNMNFW